MASKRPIDILSPSEIRKLIAQCSTRAPTGIRDAALIAMLYRCGLRIGEALALCERDINGERSSIRVHNGKGHKPRILETLCGDEHRLKQGLDFIQVIPDWCPIRAYCQGDHPLRQVLQISIL